MNNFWKKFDQIPTKKVASICDCNFCLSLAWDVMDILKDLQHGKTIFRENAKGYIQ
jgi:hypothetical protein